MTEGSIPAAPETRPLIKVVLPAANSPNKHTTVGTGSSCPNLKPSSNVSSAEWERNCCIYTNKLKNWRMSIYSFQLNPGHLGCVKAPWLRHRKWVHIDLILTHLRCL